MPRQFQKRPNRWDCKISQCDQMSSIPNWIWPYLPSVSAHCFWNNEETVYPAERKQSKSRRETCNCLAHQEKPTTDKSTHFVYWQDTLCTDKSTHFVYWQVNILCVLTRHFVYWQVDTLCVLTSWHTLCMLQVSEKKAKKVKKHKSQGGGEFI